MAVAVQPHHLFLAAALRKHRASDPATQSLQTFTQRMYPGYQVAPHHKAIIDALEAVERGEIDRLIITIPPRHGKSLLASEHFPVWYLGRNPDKRIIACSHTAQLAYTFSRRARNKITDPAWPFPVTIADDKGAVQAWDIAGRQGGYIAAGVGGPIVGAGAHVLMIDDPVKSAADADSPTQRDAVWEWYTGTAYHRLEPPGAVVLIMCMTGDTEVTMADGSVKHLRNIEVGDSVATYDNGRIASSRILNWINHGPDFTYEIRMKSGKIVRSNERHPFLVDSSGELKWVRLRDLKPGDQLIRCKVNRAIGESGAGSLASTTTATCLPRPRVTAAPTTTRPDGRPVSDLRQSILSHEGMPSSDTGMASTGQSTTRSLKRRVDGALFAESPPAPITCRSTGRASSALTIATTPEKFEDCSAITATSSSATEEPKTSYSGPLNTFEITHDQIVEIVPSGIEDVFDIEVERTGNFVANGVVSHNTRWHEDDLAGRLLREQQHGGDQWTVVDLPALALDDDVLGRKPGDALWPDKYDVPALERIRRTMGSRNFEALYQGRPTPAEGGILKRHWLRFWQYPGMGLPPVEMGRAAHPLIALPGFFDDQLQSWDLSFKQTTSGSYVAGLVGGIMGAHLYVLDRYRERTDFPGTVEAFLSMTNRWPKAITKLVEDKANGPALMDTLRSRVPGITPVSPDGTKEARMHAVSPFVEGGGLVLPHPAIAPWVTEFIDEITTFPLAANDDQADALSQMLRRIMAQRQGGFSMGEVLAAMYGGE